MTNKNVEQTSIFDLFGFGEEQTKEVVTLDATVEETTETTVQEAAVGSDAKKGIEKQKESAVKLTEEEAKAADAKKKLSTFEDSAKDDNKSKTPTRSRTTTTAKKTVGDEFKLKPDTIVKYAGQEVPVSRYFTAEQLTKGLEKKVKGETKVEPIAEKDLVKKLNDDFAELMPDLTSLVYYEKQNIVIPVLQARTKGADDVLTKLVFSSENTFSEKIRVPFQILADFISVARQFSINYETEIHADIVRPSGK